MFVATRPLSILVLLTSTATLGSGLGTGPLLGLRRPQTPDTLSPLPVLAVVVWAGVIGAPNRAPSIRLVRRLRCRRVITLPVCLLGSSC